MLNMKHQYIHVSSFFYLRKTKNVIWVFNITSRKWINFNLSKNNMDIVFCVQEIRVACLWSFTAVLSYTCGVGEGLWSVVLWERSSHAKGTAPFVGLIKNSLATNDEFCPPFPAPWLPPWHSKSARSDSPATHPGWGMATLWLAAARGGAKDERGWRKEGQKEAGDGRERRKRMRKGHRRKAGRKDGLMSWPMFKENRKQGRMRLALTQSLEEHPAQSPRNMDKWKC